MKRGRSEFLSQNWGNDPFVALPLGSEFNIEVTSILKHVSKLKHVSIAMLIVKWEGNKVLTGNLVLGYKQRLGHQELELKLTCAGFGYNIVQLVSGTICSQLKQVRGFQKWNSYPFLPQIVLLIIHWRFLSQHRRVIFYKGMFLFDHKEQTVS